MIVIEVGQFPDFAKGTMEVLLRRLTARLYKAAQLTKSALIAERIPSVKPRPPIDTGRYKSSWKTQRTSTGAVMWSEAPYAGILELGVRPGRIPPPRRAPASWALHWTYRKFRVQMGWTKRTQAWGMAIAMQRTLHAKGIEARRVTTDPAWQAKVKDITVQALGGS